MYWWWLKLGTSEGSFSRQERRLWLRETVKERNGRCQLSIICLRGLLRTKHWVEQKGEKSLSVGISEGDTWDSRQQQLEMPQKCNYETVISIPGGNRGPLLISFELWTTESCEFNLDKKKMVEPQEERQSHGLQSCEVQLLKPLLGPQRRQLKFNWKCNAKSVNKVSMV